MGGDARAVSGTVPAKWKLVGQGEETACSILGAAAGYNDKVVVNAHGVECGEGVSGVAENGSEND